MTTMNLEIGSGSNALGTVSIGGQTYLPDEKGSYSGQGFTIPDNDWVPMYFSGPGRYIWINANPMVGSGISGSMCFLQNNAPCCPKLIYIDRMETTPTIKFPPGLSWNPDVVSSPTPPVLVSTGVDLQTAIQETLNWRQFIQQAHGLGNVISCYISKEDIHHVLENAHMTSTVTIGGLRAYFALKTPNDFSSLHLFVVPTDYNGVDIITGTDNSSLIFDTTLPCPQLCGSGNLLNGM